MTFGGKGLKDRHKPTDTLINQLKTGKSMFTYWTILTENFKVQGGVIFFTFLWFKIQILQIKTTYPCITPNEPIYQNSNTDNNTVTSAKISRDV
jgi:hypothetical protein